MKWMWLKGFSLALICIGQGLFGESPAPTPAPLPVPLPPAVVTAPSTPPAKTVAKPVEKIAAKKALKRIAKPKSSEPTHPAGYVDIKTLADEVTHLLVPNQHYVLQFEDEENYNQATAPRLGSLAVTFSKEEVGEFREAIRTITDYRNQVRQGCSTPSSRLFQGALDRYISAVGSFYRRALPLSANISENNSTFILLVNRTTLKDTAILVSRYLQFKKQRFKENLDRFSTADANLVHSLVTVAKLLKVEITAEDWNRAYGLRDQALEMISLWPRQAIFDSTKQMSEGRENVCIVSLPARDIEATANVSVPPAAEVRRTGTGE